MRRVNWIPVTVVMPSGETADVILDVDDIQRVVKQSGDLFTRIYLHSFDWKDRNTHYVNVEESIVEILNALEPA